MDYEVYPADPDYYGRPTVQEFPTFDIVSKPPHHHHHPSPLSDSHSRRNSRFGGFPFPLDPRPSERRAPLPPCYSNQNLDDFLGPDGAPIPASEYTAISYYPTQQRTHSLDNVSAGYKRLSMRLSVAMPSYAETPENQAKLTPPRESNQQPRESNSQPREFNSKPPNNRPEQRQSSGGQNHRSYDGNSIVGSDYGSCEEVMF